MKIKTILITGSGSGFGKATAIELAKRGHKVLATTHHQKEANVLNELAKTAHLSIESFVLDVTKKNDREKISEYNIDVLINNAGIGETGSLAEIDIDKIRNNFEVNLFSSLELSQIVLKQMIPRNNGTIIFISSLLGRVTKAFFGSYSMTKFAISSGAEALRQEVSEIAKNVHITVVEPGAYHTGFNQKMMATKYEWMDDSSYFSKKINTIKQKEETQFKYSEEKNIDSIVSQIVSAAEADKPKFRYSAPFIQQFFVQLIRIFGK